MSQRKKTTSQSVGIQLQQAREEHNFTVEEVASALHIPRTQIEALEQDRGAEVFAAPVYAFGALRSYASWLSLDVRSLERALAQQLREADANRSDLRVHTAAKWHERLLNPGTIIALSGGIIAVIIGAYIVWQIRSFWRLPHLEITRPSTSVTEQDTVIVVGETEVGATIRVNGEPVPLQERNKFEQEIPIQSGITVIRVEAENAAGRTRVRERHILRPR